MRAERGETIAEASWQKLTTALNVPRPWIDPELSQQLVAATGYADFLSSSHEDLYEVQEAQAA